MSKTYRNVIILEFLTSHVYIWHHTAQGKISKYIIYVYSDKNIFFNKISIKNYEVYQTNFV